MATGKNWRSHHTVCQQVQKWTKSENSVIGYSCAVTLHDYTTDTNDDMTTMTVFHTEHINTNTWVPCLILLVSAYRHIAHSLWLKSWVLYSLVIPVESRSFVNRVNDQVRKRQKRISNVTENGEKHSLIWWMFMTVTMESAPFMGKKYLNNCQSIVNTTDLTLKQMFDISTRLVSEQDVISGLETICWENHSWKYLSLIGDETIINLQRTKVYVFSDSVLCLGRVHQHPESNEAWKKRIEWITSSQSYRDFDGKSVESRQNSSGTSSQDSLRCSSAVKSQIYWAD